MKKISILKSLLFASLLFTVIAATAQTEASFAALSASKKTTLEIGGNVAVPAIKGTVLTSFNSSFPSATEISWYTTAEELSYVAFNTPGKTNKAMFDKKGKLLYSLSYYSKELLPASILLKVKDNYFDQNIFGVVQINYNHATMYEIVLEGKTTWTNIRIASNEIVSEKVWRKAKS